MVAKPSRPGRAMLSDRGRVLIPVPRDRAGGLHAALRRCGCSATLCLSPKTRAAHLELWSGTDARRALAALAAG